MNRPLPANTAVNPDQPTAACALSSVQEVVWLDQSLHPQAPIYHVGMAWELRGAIDAGLLRRAVNQVARRHDALRTVFEIVDGLPLQRVLPSVDVAMQVVDARGESLAPDGVQAWLQRSFVEPFGELQWDTRLLTVREDLHYWLPRFHHLVNDGFGVAVFIHEVAADYGRLREGGEAAPDTPSYREFVADDARYLASDRHERDRRYWRDHLADLPEPLFNASPVARHSAVAPSERLAWHLPRAQFDRLQAFATSHGHGLAQVLMATIAAYFARVHQRDRVAIGLPVHNRGTARQKRTVGMFASMNPAVLRVDGAASFLSLVEEAAAETRRNHRHQRLPIAELHRDLRVALSGRDRIHDVALSMMNFDGDACFGAARTRVIPLHHGVERTPLVIEVRDHHRDGDVLIEFVYVTAHADRARIESIRDGMAAIFAAVLADATQPVAQLPMLGAAERARVIHDFNATSLAVAEGLVHARFEAQAASQPDADALVFGARRWTYAQLDRRANQVAHRLLALGVQPDDRVAICMARGAEMVAALLGILKAGACYVPLDPGYPADRLAGMLEDSAPKALLVDGARPAWCADEALPCVGVDGGDLELAAQPTLKPAVAVQPSNAAYVIYTSGSTGRPKGVVVEHRQVVNFLASMAREPGLNRSDVLLAVTTIGFDIAGLELYLPLSEGATIVLARRDEAADAKALAALLVEHGVTVMQATPATWRLLVASGWSGRAGLKVLCGGEALTAELSTQLQSRVGEVWNVYGPTETTIWSTCRRCEGDATGVAESIGKPIANTQVYVLDAQRRPVPVGVSGELYIAGDGVARGYLNRPELTAERFVEDPFSEQAGTRMYRTGDLGRWNADGTLAYLGRNDFQVKIRGFRIELGEIEAQLAKCDGVREAVVVAREDQPGDQRLVAYIVGDVRVETLRARLALSLAEFMLPSAWVVLDALPLTPNGKLDRKALPAPDEHAIPQQAYEAPQGELEEAVAAIWQELLGLPRVGRQDHFFELGGHSLTAVQLIARLHQNLGVELGLRTLFEQPTLAGCASAVQGASTKALARIKPVDRSQPLALSFAQQRLWFLDQLNPQAATAYHMPGALELAGPLDVAALRRALDRIVARHESLRTTFENVDGQVFQRIAGEDLGFALAHDDLSALDGHEHQAAVQRHRLAEARQRFDLAHGPLVRARLLRLREDEHVLLVTQHHIVSDGWSVGVLLGELRALYTAFAQGQADPLAPLAIQYADYAAWQRGWLQGERLQAQTRYWREQLAGAPGLLELPTDRARPALPSHAAGRQPVVLPREVVQGLRALGQRHGATLFMTLLAGWSALLARLGGQGDLVIGVPVANRQQAALEPLIGFFVNTLPLRLRPDANGDVAQWLHQVRTATLAAFDHQDVPFDQIVDAVQPHRSTSHAPLCQVLFSMNPARHDTPFDAAGLHVDVIEHGSVRNQYDLVLDLRESGDDVHGALFYASDLFDEDTIGRLLTHLDVFLAAFATQPAQALSRLPLLAPAQRAQLLVDFNGAPLAPTDGPLLHQLFEDHAACAPDAVAIVFGEASISYGELNERANQVAHRLIALGVGRDDCVALCTTRGPLQVAGFLGILKAGAAYVPLDATHPPQRLADMLADCAPRVLLTESSLAHVVPVPLASSLSVERVLLDGIGASTASPNPRVDALGLEPRHLAYVIFTSGSTGRPKGVMNHHHGLRNLALAQREVFGLDASARVLQFASCSFDASVFEMAMALANGAALVMAAAADLAAGGPLLRTLRAQRVTHATLPSSLVATLDGDEAPPLRCLVMAGEACPPHLAARWADRMAVFNAYGPTETTVWASTFRCRADHATPVPIGRPIAQARLYVVDAHLQPVPVGVVGEICIGGAGVARGYLNQPELTADRFVRDPFSGDAGATMYRSGDLGRWLADGNVEYVGRNDAQVKLRGFRIEIGEIEARLIGCDGVREAAVVAREDAGAERQLVAYVVAGDGAALDAAVLREQLRAHLPDHMLPAAFVALETMPLTSNGKIDRRALPTPAGARTLARAYVAPQGAAEIALAAIWQTLLATGPVGRDDHFFERGGHSLLVVQLVAHVRQAMAATLSLQDVFAHPTLSAMCLALATSQSLADEGAIVAATGDRDRLPLSFAEQRLWVLDQLDAAAGSAYRIAGAFRLQGRLDVAALQRALDRIVARHESLRTTFDVAGDSPARRVADPACGFALERHDLSAQPDGLRGAALQRIARDEADAGFDLARAPLVRGRLVALGADDHVLFVTQHHIVSDGWSVGILLDELRALYAAFLRGEPDPLPPLALQYADYAAWQRAWLAGPRRDAQEAWWREQLAGAPALLELPLDRPRPALQSHAGASLAVTFPPGLAAALRTLSQRHESTLFMTLLAGWAAVLSRLSGQTDLVVGSFVANRPRAELDGLIGFFVNTLALRVTLDDDPTMAELLARVRQRTLGAYANQDLPFDQLVDLVQPARSMSHSPLFQVVLGLNNTPGARALGLEGVAVSPMPQPTGKTTFDLALRLEDDGVDLAGELDYATDLFDATTVQAMLGRLTRVLQAMADDDGCRVSALPIVDARERALVVHGFNATALALPELALHARFEAQVGARPHAVALEFEDRHWSYADIDRRANQIAHRLLALGVQPDDRVAVCAQRGPEMIFALMGILKAGAAYVSLDPAYPADRLAFMLQDSAPRALLMTGELPEALAGVAAASQVPCLALDAATFALQPGTRPPVEVRPGHLAYVIYTSGSTGLPKGVLIEHRNASNFLGWALANFAPAELARTLFSTSINFDLHVFELFAPLSCGARITLVRDVLAGTRGLDDLTTINTVPSTIQALLDLGQVPATVATVNLAGEPLKRALVERLFASTPVRSVANLYGPSETTTYSTWTRMSREDGFVPHIGKPIANTQVYLLDANREPVPVGVSGEIFIGGAGVARGYLNRPELSAERFVADSFSGQAGARLYRTGDLGRWNADGTLVYLGRNDFQVKIRGFRVELGEIEARLAQCEGVREAVVLALQDDGGEKRLVAYVVAEAGHALVVHALRDQLSRSLSEVMLPSAWVVLDALPLTPNGKLDRKALPAPDASALAQRAYEAPRGDVECAIAAVWQELLGVERVGRDDHFFELGGHSLMALQLLGRLRQSFAVELGLRELFDHPTLAQLARSIAAADSRRDDTAAIALVDRSVPQPLSFAQQRLWFLARLDAEAGSAYHIPAALRLTGALDRRALQAALDRLLDRHDSLRTRFVQVDDQPCQIIEPTGATFALAWHDLSALDDDERDAAVARHRRDEPARRFDLARGPLVRGRLLKLASDEHLLLVTQHHIVSDGWSIGILARELCALYDAFTRGQPDPLAPLALHYVDYAVSQRRWLQGDKLARQTAFWREQLTGAPALLALPTDRPRPATPSHAGASLAIEFTPELSEGLRALAQRHGATLFMTLLAGWAALMSRLSGQPEVVVGSPVANRPRSELEGLIGFFVNTLAMRVTLGDEMDVAQLLAHVRHRTLDAYAHQELPFEQVVEALQPPRSMSHSPIFQVMLGLNNTPGQRAIELTGVTVQSLPQGNERSAFDLVLLMEDDGESLSGVLHYATDLFDGATADALLERYRTVLQAMVADEACRVSRLPVLHATERQRVLRDFNATTSPIPPVLIHERFEQQVDARPDAIALESEGRSWTYADLDRRANQVAHRLLALGVQPDDRVAICAQRRPEMVVGLLGILKAGAGYVPLDPAYPADRLAFMLADSAPRALLAVGEVPAALSGLPVVQLGEHDDLLAAQPSTRPNVALRLDTLGYVIYTSGSTGRPNGVQVEHRNVLRLVVDGGYAPLTADDCVAHCASPSFDASTWELWGALLNGARVLLVSQAVLLDPPRLNQVLIDGRVTAMWLTAGLFNQLVDALAPAFATLRWLLVGGDALDPAIVRRVLRRPQRPMHLLNGYGPTETTTFATTFDITLDAIGAHGVPIGRPIGNTQVYILDATREPVPVGVSGEIYIGGAGVARGYLNRPELTAERFVADPFSDQAGARLYRTGDLGRWRADGAVEYQGRNDFQVKIRGFRVELGEVEARLAQCDGVREAAVIARQDDGGEKRLVAYVVAEAGQATDVHAWREQLARHLSDVMLPSAWVMLDALPLTPNGKLDRRALPAPDETAIAQQSYEAPQGEVEDAVASVWQALLGLPRVGRHDHFFELGGHSLMVISAIERLCRRGLRADVRMVFEAPTPAALAARLGAASVDEGEARAEALAVPANLIPEGATSITPDMLPLVQLTAEQVDSIVARIPGGAANIQDIYPLAPLQQGILYHHMMEEQGDLYLLRTCLGFDTRDRLDAFLAALQAVIARHDILRTAFLWSRLPQPVQVVVRAAPLPIVEVDLSAHADVLAALSARAEPAARRFDLARAPLFAAEIARDGDGRRWHLALLYHHLVADHVTLERIVDQVQAIMAGRVDMSPPPLPYRDFVARTLAVDGAQLESHFRARLGDVTEPTAPFGLLAVREAGARVEEAHLAFDASLALDIRATARRVGVTPAVLFHAAWAQVLGRCTGRSDVVFGTVLFGRMQGRQDAGRMLGLFINTLPVRIALDAGVHEAVRQANVELGELLLREQAPLTLAQRCSGLDAQTPLFTTLLNYRHVRSARAGDDAGWPGVTSHPERERERVSYPIGLSINDVGDGFSLSALCDGVAPGRMAAMLEQAMRSLVTSLAREADPVRLQDLDVLSIAERALVVRDFNDTALARPDTLLHTRFEAQAASQPDADALVFGARRWTYAQLDRRANQVAHRLLALGVQPDDRVAICMERGAEMVAALLGILKAGACYVPLDPGYPADRLASMLEDSAPKALLVDGARPRWCADEALPCVAVAVDGGDLELAAQPTLKPAVATQPSNAAYVIYTSGSTGRPKGVVVEHRQVVNFLASMAREPGLKKTDVLLAVTTIGFDIAGLELYLPLSEGATIVLARRDEAADAKALAALLVEHGVTVMQATPATWRLLVASGWSGRAGLKVLCGGEALTAELSTQLQSRVGEVWNVYGPTETTIWSTCRRCEGDATGVCESIGKPIANTQVYVLDAQRRPVPVGVSGELYIAGDGVARGYLNRPELTAERFVEDPFSDTPNARMYRTGDLGRWNADGTLVYLGRNDFQVKIRGFRIELGEIEAQLAKCDGVREAVVVAREDQPGDQRLVAYIVGDVRVETLRARLALSLAEFMLPSAWVVLDALPLTPNGKLDRKALPAPDERAIPQQAYEAPQGELEEAVAAIWQELLGVSRVGRGDHFFELGGHSLTAVLLVGRLHDLCHVELALKDLFQNPTLVALASRVASLQFQTYLGADQGALMTELDAMSESELMALLAEEEATQ